MSYNVTSTTILSSDGFALPAEQAYAELLSTCEFVPESLLDYRVAVSLVGRGRFPFGGEGSGNDMGWLRRVFLPACTGSAELLFTWEGGDYFTGARVRNGIVTMHRVEFSLGDEVTQ